MHGITFAIFGLLIVVQVQSAYTKRQVPDEKIQFVDHSDKMDAIRENIRTDMDQYRRLKEMSIKSKSSKTTTTIEAPVSSSTLRQVCLIDYEEPELEDAPVDVQEEMEGVEIITGLVNNKIFDAPVVCKVGYVLVGTRCRKLTR